MMIFLKNQWIFSISSEGNLANISTTIPINISMKLGFIENILIQDDCTPSKIDTYTTHFKEFFDGFAWYYNEMLDIDPQIIQYQIKTYPGANPVRKKLWLVNPHKATTIKDEIQKLIDVGFIYLEPSTKWVSNPIPVDKKEGTIQVRVDYCDLNVACHKDNYPTPFID